jgi:biopolymer transport protein ExbD
MQGFKKKTKTSQDIPTAALPDIIFILLFFFMVATKERPKEPQIKITPPKLTQLEKSGKEPDEYIVFFIGKPKNTAMGSEPKIFVDDAMIQVSEISSLVKARRVSLKERANLVKAKIKSDKGVKLGVVSDIKTELRKEGVFRVEYEGIEVSKIRK